MSRSLQHVVYKYILVKQYNIYFFLEFQNCSIIIMEHFSPNEMSENLLLSPAGIGSRVVSS